jgi:hypothetical protein
MVLLNINAIELPEAGGTEFTPVPEGWYSSKITASDVRTGKDSGKDYLNLEFTITAGDFASRKLWMVYALWHDNPDVVKWAKEKLGKLASALKMSSVEDHEDLIGKQLDIKVGLDRNNRNEVKYCRALSTDVESPSSNGKAAPAWA